MSAGSVEPLRIFIVAGEESGDQLGAGLMQALDERLGGAVRFEGVGGSRMTARGLKPLFPLSDIAHNGITAVLRNGPLIRWRMRNVIAAVLRSQPDALVVIDSPDFNLVVARRIRKRDRSLPIIDYVSPTVWAWRPGRARRMAAFIDHLMALLPFEPAAHLRLGGPPCTYVGHPLLDRIASLRPAPGERPALAGTSRPTILIMPGSRRSELRRLLQPFGEALTLLRERIGEIEAVLPAVPHLAAEIRAGVTGWPVAPQIVEGEAEKFAAFRRAHAALVASGTATLELGLSAVPMVVAYKLDALSRGIKFMVRVPSIVLTNLILGENAVPEFIDNAATPVALAEALAPLATETPQRAAQLAAFARLDGLMSLAGSTPTAEAARVVLEAVAAKRSQRRLETGT
jgi:lipid-A-disaccharide synthase